MLNSQDLTAFINEQTIAAKIVPLTMETLTVPSAAAALGISTDQIVKSILFLLNGEPLLVIANGTARIDYKKLATYVNLSRRRIKLATAEQVLAITGFVVGSVPPFGHKRPLRTIVETAVYNKTTIYGGGGESHALLRVDTIELKRVVGMKTAVLQKQATEQQTTL